MRKRSHLDSVLAIVAIAVASGCMAPWSMGTPASNSVSVVREASTVSSEEQAASTGPAKSLEPGTGDLPKTQEEAMTVVLDDLSEIGAIDQEAQQELMADLREAKPEQWPSIAKQFKSALAYREQLAARESLVEAKQMAKQLASPGVIEVSKVAKASVYAMQGGKKTAPALIASETHSPQDILKVSATEPSRETPAETSLESTKLLPPPTTAVALPEKQAIEQASYETPVAKTGSSQEHLQAAITSLEQSTQESPANVEDVQQHMRLRMLKLLAGQESEAILPIPGASSTQQDYWSKQLFAISTYLDSEQQPDVKRRAAGSLVHLDRARDSLAELATLQVRNLTFVDSVDGFGAYKERETTKFSPGDQVTLYAEVENFRSESTKEGYHTQLSTSYEVFAKGGQRVEGAQFPDVEDLCKNQRRDFHMQYGVALPTRIFAGQYELQLTITDQLSHKIGQTSVPFEIVE